MRDKATYLTMMRMHGVRAAEAMSIELLCDIRDLLVRRSESYLNMDPLLKLDPALVTALRQHKPPRRRRGARSKR